MGEEWRRRGRGSEGDRGRCSGLTAFGQRGVCLNDSMIDCSY